MLCATALSCPPAAAKRQRLDKMRCQPHEHLDGGEHERGRRSPRQAGGVALLVGVRSLVRSRAMPTEM
jgi:hypothetical protein